MSREARLSYCFKTFRLDVTERRLFNDDQIVSLTPRAFDVLVYLVERGGHLVGKEQIMQAVWGDSFVEEANVARIVHTLRKVLGETETGNKFIETVSKKGYRFVADLAVIGEGSGQAGQKAGKSTPENSYKSRLLIVIPAVAVVLVFLGLVAYWSSSKSDSRFETVQLRAVTASGNVGFPAISPDGRLVVFVKTEAGKPSLWIRQIALRTSEIRLTEPKTDETFNGAAFSPDGSKVFFLLKPRNNSVKQLYSVPILGGEDPKAVLADMESSPAFSPDGKQFAFMRRDLTAGTTTLLVSREDGTSVRELASRKAPSDFMLKPLTWSPDGKTIACFSTKTIGKADRHLVHLDADTGVERFVSPQAWIWVDSVVWTKNNELIFSASDVIQPLGTQLWKMPMQPGSEPRRITHDLNDYTDLTLAANTGEILAVQAQWDSYVWLESLKSPEASRRISQNKSDGSQGIAWVSDGDLIFSSVINGKNGLQKASMSDFSVTSLTEDDKYVFRNPIVTPDGRYIIYSSNQGEPEGLWRMEIDGRNPIRLTNMVSDLASSSPDSRTIYFSSSINGQSGLWKISIDGGGAEKVSERIGARPRVSPDGSRIAFYFRADTTAAWQIGIISADGQEFQVFDLPKTVSLNSHFAWSPDGKGFVLIDSRDAVNNLWNYPLDRQLPTQLTRLPDDSFSRLVNFSVSPNGERIALTRGRRTSDVVLIERPRPQ